MKTLLITMLALSITTAIRADTFVFDSEGVVDDETVIKVQDYPIQDDVPAWSAPKERGFIPGGGPAGYAIIVQAEDFTFRYGDQYDAYWFLVDGQSQVYKEGPLEGEPPATIVKDAMGDYVEHHGRTFYKSTHPLAPDYDGPFLEYEFYLPGPGRYELWVRWAGRDGGSDSLYGYLIGPEGERVKNAGTGYFLFHGRSIDHYRAWTWDNAGVKDSSVCANRGYPDKAVWNILFPGTYTVRLLAREAGTAVDALALQRME